MKPYNHEYAGSKNTGNIEEDSNSEEEEKKEAAPSTEATLPSDFLVQGNPIEVVLTQLTQL